MEIERWQGLSLAEQLGNIASELSRAKHWEDQEDVDERFRSFERALRLIDLTLADRRWIGRRRELVILRHVADDLFAKTGRYDVTLETLIASLLPFAFLARSKK